MTFFSLRIEEKCTVNEFGRPKLGLNLSKKKKLKDLRSGHLTNNFMKGILRFVAVIV